MIKRKLLISLLPVIFFLFSGYTRGQVAYDCTIQQVINGGSLEVSIYIQSTGATSFKIGGANFRFNVNTSGLDISSAPTEIAEGLWDDGNDPVNYGDQGVGFNQAAGWASIDIFGEGTLDGVTVPSTPTLVGTMSIPITNTSLNSDITWRTASAVSNTEVIDVNLNDITANGTFNDPGVFPLPVELKDFTASTKFDEVILNWKTATEVNNYGFEIERAAPLIPPAGGNNRRWEKIGFVEGNGNSNSPKQYKYTDRNPWGGSKFVYRLKQIDNDGTYIYSDEVEVELLPAQYELYQNYPNPFNPSTSIKFSLPETAKVNIRIYNTLGELVSELVNKEFEAGYHRVEFNANNLASGIYFYRLSTSKFSSVKKMLLIK